MFIIPAEALQPPGACEDVAKKGQTLPATGRLFIYMRTRISTRTRRYIYIAIARES